MCLLKVKEEPDYSVPARVKKVRWSHTYSPSPPRTAYYSNTHVVEERRPPSYISPPKSELPAPPPPQSEHYSVSRTSVKRSEAPSPPSVHQSVAASETKHTSRAPSTTSRSRTHYVEVDHDSAPDSSSSSSSSDDLRSRTTHKTSRTSHTQRSSKSRTTAPASEYSIHEREQEIRRERAYSRPRGEYETYRYVDAPSGYYGPRASSGSYRRDGQGSYR